MKEYLVYSGEGSNKFWSISTQGDTFTVVFGKVGTAGQTQIKSFDSAGEADAQAQKQAASKIKKGYKPATPPEGFGAAPVSDTVGAKSVPAKPKKAAVPQKAPVTAVDDGVLQPWHKEDGDFWEYSWDCPDEGDFAVDVLSQPEENGSSGADSPAQPVRKPPAAKEEKPQLYWGGGNYGDDDNDDDDDDSPCADFNVYTFARLCYKKPLAEVQKAWNNAVSAGVGQDKLQSALNRGVELIFTYSLYAHGLENLPWILEKGGTLTDVDGADEPYAEYFWKQYQKVNDPAKAADILNGFLDRAYNKMAPMLADGLTAVLQAIESGEYDKESGVERLPTNEDMEWCTGFRLRTYQDKFYVYIETKEKTHNTLFTGRFDDTDDIIECVAEKYLPGKLRPLIEKMGEDGLFDNLGIPCVSIRYYDTGEVFFQKVLDEKLAEEKKREAEALVRRLEATEQFEEDAPLLGDAISFLLRGPLEQDVPRASALIGRFLYCLNDEAEERANQMLCDYDDEYPQLQYDRALWLHSNGDYKSAHNVMGFAADKGYDPAAEKRREFEELARQRALLAPKSGGGGAKKMQKGGAEGFFQTFTEQDVFLNSENVIARACSQGNIHVRFKVEGEDGYSETLDFLCNLLEKGYSRLHGGYTLRVRFLQRPEFIKKLPGFPKNTCHAFFAKAVRYPALREKVRRYADLALVEFDWYKDLDGEENTVPGTFAACALALCDESYIHMAGQYARNSDDEHQYIQLEVAPALLKEYGPVPAVAKALFDISASNGQDGDMGRMPKELYTIPENLSAIMEHIESGVYSQRQLEWHVPQYVETIMTGNIKGNLKKLKGLWQAETVLADKKTYADFYNTYKNYASIREEEDYGEDLTSGPVGDLVLPTYHEDPPVVMSLKEFKARYPDTNIDGEYPAERQTVLFIPQMMDNPYLLDYAFRQWEVLCKIAREAPSSYFWHPTAIQMGDWIINLTAPAKECGVILYDGKTKNARPIVLYGMLNLAPLFSRFHKRPFKSQEEAEAARLANLIEDAPDHCPITPEERGASERYEAVCSVVLTERHYAAGKLLPTFTPEDGRFYDAALIQRAILAHRLVDPVAEKAIYEELLERKPEFAEYWNEKLKKL